ncbi:MAG: MBL fold metallo-hydrolase [Myxococcaceae bacterium]|nr:MBL fold metallo-hydrolase [Myxococcaceae bacterium]
MRFWGVRGSIPSPGPETSRYGGNTPCVEVRIGEELVLFDLGTGVREFGQAAPRPVEGAIFLSHYHYDHLQGLPFFGPIFDPRSRFVIRGPTRDGRTVKDVIAGQMQQPFFPVTAEMVFRAHLEYEPFAAGDRAHVGQGVITAIETHHPGGNLAYRIECRGRSIVYATDTEHGTARDAQLVEFARGADVFIYDAMYTEDEYLGRSGSPRIGWGHSTLETAVKVADDADVGTLVLFHHEPTRTDDAMDELVKTAKRLRKNTIAAKEGLVLKL